MREFELSDNISVAGPVNEDVDVNPADQIAGERRQDGYEADDEGDPEGEVKNK